MRVIFISLLVVTIFVKDASAQLKKAKTWEVLRKMMEAGPPALSDLLKANKYEMRGAPASGSGWIKYVDHRTLYMEPGGGMMYDSMQVFLVGDETALITFIFGNDNGDAGMAALGLDELDRALTKDGFFSQVQKKNEYTEKRSYVNLKLAMRVDADLWIRDSAVVLVRMRVYRDGLDPEILATTFR